MAIYTIDESQRKAARVAGFAYLFTLAPLLALFEKWLPPPMRTASQLPAILRVKVARPPCTHF
jgi:hypothetical protein